MGHRSKVVLFLALGACPVADEPARSQVELEPAEGLAGTRVTVHVRGSNTHFDAPDFRLAMVGPDVRIVDERPDSATAARVVLEIDEDAAPGSRTLVIEAAGERFEKQFQVRVAERGEAAVALAPEVGTPGADVDVDLAGTSTHFEQGATSLSFPEAARIQVRSLVVRSPTAATARIHIDADAPGGAVAAAVMTRDDVVYDRFEVVTQAAPTLTSDPSVGFAGHRVDVTISGPVDFRNAGGDAVVAFLDDPAIWVSDVRVVSPSVLGARFTIPSDSAQGFRRFTVGVDLDRDTGIDEVIASGPFYVRAPGAPSVSVSPNSVSKGTRPFVWVEGHSTAFGPGTQVRAVPGTGVAITGLWIFGPEQLAVRLDVAMEALLGTTELTIDDGSPVSAPFEVLAAPEPRASLAPGRIERGASGAEVEVGGIGTSFERGVTLASVEPGSGVFVTSLSVTDETSAAVVLDVQPSAPDGETSLTFETKGERVQAPLTIVPDGDEASVELDPPVVRAGLGQVEVVASGEELEIGADSEVRVVTSDPSIAVGNVQADGGGGIRIGLDIGRAARVGSAVVVIGDGTDRTAGRLTVLGDGATVVTTAPSSLPAGAAGRLLLLVGEGTSFIDGVTVAAGPPGRGLSVGGLTVIDRTTAIVELTVLSDSPPGDTGILLATHGEIATAPLSLTAATTVPSISIEPATLEPGEATTLTVHGVGTDFSGTSTNVDFPGSREVLAATAARLLDADTLEIDVAVEPDAEAGTVPLRVQSGADVITSGIAVITPDAPILRLEPYSVRRGETTTLGAVAEGMDLGAQAPSWFSEPADGVVVAVRVVDATHADMDVTVDSAVDDTAIWLGLEAAGARARQRLIVTPGLQSASTAGASVESGSVSNEVTVTGTMTTFSPGETVASSGAPLSALRFGEPAVAGPTQLGLAVDVSAAADGPSRVLLTTGPDLAVAMMDVRRSAPAQFTAGRTVAGTVLAGLSALVTRTDAGGGFLAMSAVAAEDGPGLRVGLIATDGFTRLALPIGSSVVYPAPEGAIARIELEPGAAPEGPVGFMFVAQELPADAQSELEPNDAQDLAEPIGDPTISPAVLACAIEPTAELDLFVVQPTLPAVVEAWSRRLSGASAVTPDLSISLFDPEGELVGQAAAGLGEDPAILLQPEPVTVRFDGLAGSMGPYVAVFRSAVVVNEIGWSEDDGFLELRAAPDLPLDDYSLELLDDAGRQIVEVGLDRLAARSNALFVLSAADALAPDVFLDARVPFDGVVVVRYGGEVVDAVAFGASDPAEGDPALVGDRGAIGRTLGIDRNDNAVDFTGRDPSPGVDGFF
ncbi:MAG: hypothetical protein HYY06_31270 [Deltaproteobacteria bacterium]|nr:hypothetical protein [Deltaproteobacteria bacterium]